MQGTALFLDRYEVRGLLGRGGMGDVRDGWDRRLNRPVAIKLLHPQYSHQPHLRARFRTEAAVVAALEHPNIVAVYDSGEHDGIPFIVMERLPGGTLADQIALGPVAEPCARMMLVGTLAALAVAHANGVLHRDIKPGNILHTFGGDAYKVGDFGIAKTPGGALTVTGQIFGTIAYLSPERLCGAQASVADDLYAVGVVGYEALTGRRAFGPDDNIGALTHAVLRGDRVPLPVVRPDVDPGLAAVVERAMARDPRQRFGSAEEMGAALAAPAFRPPTKVLDGPPVPLTYVPPLPPPRSMSRRKRMLAAGAVLAALAVTALAFALDGPSSQPAPTPISTSTSVRPPATSSALPPPTTSLVEQPLPDKPHGNGNGKRDDKGKGPKR
ncbi:MULTISPECIES: protein kinase domain-containing protein [unclassified Mycobacterium]|uniref:protein kinase domain-containing protein n=1 Tax=unclassified Mycobacterium TaxID=2642494 RepID=UPI0029C72C35|nr:MULTISPECIES: protein kinase [unclassified Mycobacterium]